MTLSVLQSIGRCDGVRHPVSIRKYHFQGSNSENLSLRERLNTPLKLGHSVEDWLNENPRVRDQISWEHDGFWGLGSQSTAYRDWPNITKAKLQEKVDLYAECGRSALTDPPTNRISQRDNEQVRTIYSNVDAFQWYISILAQTLTIEMGRWTNWSLADYSDDVLYHLLDSRTLFSWRSGDQYEIHFTPHAPSTPAEPRRTYEFLYQNDLIGHNRLNTIHRLVDWCRWHLSHYHAHEVSPDVFIGGRSEVIGMELHWQYRGFAPVRRIIEGTTRQVTNSTRHWTAGCHGTVGFLKAVLRQVNIPVRYLRQCGHAIPHFMHEDIYLSHGDDPYNQCVKRDDLLIETLFIDQAKYEQFFESEADPCDHIGDGAREAQRGLPFRDDLPAFCFEDDEG